MSAHRLAPYHRVMHPMGVIAHLVPEGKTQAVCTSMEPELGWVPATTPDDCPRCARARSHPEEDPHRPYCRTHDIFDCPYCQRPNPEEETT
jgi:endogenous inhibitor of DNA gyrase (YacG/DUF329 family)